MRYDHLEVEDEVELLVEEMFVDEEEWADEVMAEEDSVPDEVDDMTDR
jgi:hypothetical protein